jgi:2-succinyl-5-enolpyruvyl-6-hydroxy-3-cyclohexene-1-carboxylate synthase
MVGNSCEHVAQIRLRIDTVEFCGANQAVDCGGTFAARVRTSKQIVAATNGYPAQRAFDG